MGIIVSAGDKLPLSIQLYDGDTSKFVQVKVFNHLGAAIIGSPFSVPHLTDGLYVNSTSAIMPSVPYAVATYTVYDDALFSTVSAVHGSGTDLFIRGELDVTITGVDTTGGMVAGIIDKDVTLVGLVTDDAVEGQIECE